MSIIFLLMLMYLHNTSTLVCIANSSLEILHSEFTSNNDSFTLHKLHNKTIYPYKKSTVCRVTIYIDYNQINGNITFELGGDTNHSGNYIGIETWIPLTKENNSIVSLVEYMCSSNNLCDLIFVEKWIYWLANIKHGIVQNNLIDLLTYGNHSGKCDATGKPVECSGGLCLAEYTSDVNKTILAAGCLEDALISNMELYMKMQSIELQPIQYKELIYVCSSDKCNDESTFNRVWKETSTLFDFFKPIVDWLRLRKRCRTSLNCSHGKIQNPKEVPSITYASIHKTSSSTILFWSSCITVVVLIVICIGFYYLYRRNRQGYTPASTSA